MTSESETEHASPTKRQAELIRYLDLFEAAFDELHAAVTNLANKPGQLVGPHHDYPKMRRLDSGFPAFSEAGFYDDKSPRDYVGMLRPRGLLGALGGRYPHTGLNFPRSAELTSFLRTNEVGEKLKLTEYDRRAEYLVGDAVERYLHLYGLNAPLVKRRRDAIIEPLLLGTISENLNLSLVIPITMTQFDVDRFSLTETSYIARMPRRLQLARARISTLGSGAEQMVVGAATHAFVSNGWTLEIESIQNAHMSLRHASPNMLDAADAFFGALRVATGISTGYAQLLLVPRRCALEYYCDLTPVHGTTMRRYPSEYDNYGWAYTGASVSAEQLDDVRKTYRQIAESQSEAIRLALSRLNGCLTRSDAADAILDGTIGLELLLGDDENQSLSYKLRLRAAALAMLQPDPTYSAAEVATKVKRLYEARSKIVHGRRKKRSKAASEPVDTANAAERSNASDLLRFALKALLAKPEYLDPARIDAGLLLRGDDVAVK